MNGTKAFDWPAAKARLERARLAIESESRSDQQLEVLYSARAALLAQPLDPAFDSAGEDVMILRLGTARYGIPLGQVAEVAPRNRIAPVPGAPAEIAGLIQIRGDIRVIWNLERILGLKEPTDDDQERTVVLLRTERGEAGILVSEVEDIRRVEENERRPPPDGASHASWMTEDLIIVLDTSNLLPGKTEEN